MGNIGIRIITSLTSNITFMLSMMVVILIAACFLGRYVVISRKMVLGALGIVIIETILVLFFNFNEIAIQNKANDFVSVYLLEDTSDGEIMSVEDAADTVKLLVGAFVSIIINSVAFVYAFVFYLFSFREKRVLRAFGACIGLYGYYMYMQTTILYAMIYLRGGDAIFYESLVFSRETVAFPMMIYQIICLAITAGVLAILYFGYYRRKKFYVISVKTRIFFILWLVIFSIFPTLPMGLEENVSDRFYLLSIIMGVLLPVVGTLAPVLLIMNASDKSLKERVVFQENYLNAELDYIEQYKQKQTETRAFRHDIVNNLTLLDMMMKDDKNEEAKEHLEGLLESVAALSPEYVTGDEMLDCIVAMKADKIKQLSIAFTADGVIDGGLNMRPMDICGIFANALDNAIEAAVKVKDNPKISFEIKRTERFFVVRITNSTVGKVDVEKLLVNAGYTSKKKDMELHGFGLRNIKDTAAKYDGIVKAESREGEFTLSVMIPRDE